MIARDRRRRLAEQLEIARRRGMLGTGSVGAHLEHTESMATAIGRDFSGRFLDLGSGGGVPGVILLELWPAATGVLLESRPRRCAFLEETIGALGLFDRGSVACGRAEELARDGRFRGRFEVVVARAFGQPATTAECAVGFLAAGGRLAVSEPPGAPDPGRWPEDGLAALGLSRAEVRKADGAGTAILTVMGPTEERWPRRTGVPARRPLW